jgi:hypothetical protein
MTRLTATNTHALDRITRIMTELALDHDQRDPLARHLDRVCVPELMRGGPATDAGRDSGVVELYPDGCRSACAAACRSA